MATLNEVMKETADAIREKTGKSELIAPVNFAEEIKSISVGGSAEGGSSIEYLDVSENTQISISLRQCALAAKMMKGEDVVVGPPDLMRTILVTDGNQGGVTTLAVAIDFTSITKARIGEQYVDTSLMQLLGMAGITKESLDSIPRITKEQFYTLE